MTVYSAFSSRPRKGHPTTTTHKDRFTIACDERGNKHLEYVETIDRYAVIQSFKDECDISNIVNRVTITGDVSLLQRRPSMYGDFTDLPSDLHSLEMVMKNAEAAFASMPAGKFASFAEFLDAFSSQSKFDAAFKKEDPAATPKEEVTANA